MTGLRSGKCGVGILAGSRFVRSAESQDQLFELPVLLLDVLLYE